jgi:oligopeptide/dipeptide ABC transporter ATP-binding protein
MTGLGPGIAAAAGAPVSAPLLDVRALSVAFPGPRGAIYAAHDVSFAVARGRSLGLVGESGSGKSVTLRALLRLVSAPGRIVAGQVVFEGRDLMTASPQVLRSIRGKDIAMIFQDPMASLNPVLTVGDQLSETLRLKMGLGRKAAEDRAVGLLDRVGIPSARARMRAHPHEFSGGMAQRVMIAIALGPNPKLLLADEPTTALDVSVQDQILTLLEDLRAETGMAIVIVSHDLGVIARACDDVMAMYAGRLLERGTVDEVLREPRHPYTRLLLATIPSLRPNINRTQLATITGTMPNLADVVLGCPFASRCEFVRPGCEAVPMTLDAPSPMHGSACPFV